MSGAPLLGGQQIDGHDDAHHQIHQKDQRVENPTGHRGHHLLGVGQHFIRQQGGQILEVEIHMLGNPAHSVGVFFQKTVHPTVYRVIIGFHIIHQLGHARVQIRNQDGHQQVTQHHEAGYDLLLADQRAHGRSEGRFIGFGILERRDLKAWTEELNRRFGADEPTFLAGISMGATTVLMAAGGELPDNTRGIIADCGFTSPKDIVVHELHALFHLPRYPLLPIVDLLCRLLAGYGFGDYSTLTAMETNTLPIFFIHGGGDNFVPTEMTRLNYAACRAEKRLLIVPGADHGMSWLEDPESYQRELSEFLARYGGARDSS